MDSLFEVRVLRPHFTWQGLRAVGDARICLIRQRLEELWQSFQPYADSHFRHEFAKHPHQRFWEMFLCVFLLESGKNVVAKSDRVQSGPDILVEEDGEIWIEAVAPATGEPGKPDTVPELQADGKTHSVPGDPLLLRFLQAMDEKRKKQESYLADKIIAPGDPYIIAINAGDQDGFGGFSGVFDRALYPTRTKTLGDPDWKWGDPYQVTKSNGSVVPASVLVGKDYQNIAGVIFSPSGIGDLASPAEEFHFFPNPNCDTRIAPKWAQWTREHVLSGSAGCPSLIELEHGQERARVLGQFPSSPSTKIP